MSTTSSIHNFTVKDVDGQPVDLGKYRGKVLLIVNTASKCGFTPQLEELEELYKEFHSEGFEILAFPSNDFGGQEPLNGVEIKQFCLLKYQANYPIFDKIHVKGPQADKLYLFLSDKKQNGAISSAPRWNFHKYLINREGQVVDYFYSFTSPTATKVKKAIKKLL